MTFMVRVLDVQSSRQVIFGFLASEDSVLFLRVVRDHTGSASSSAATATNSFESIGPLELNSKVARQYFGMFIVFCRFLSDRLCGIFTICTISRNSDPTCFYFVLTAALLTAPLTDLGYEPPKFDSNPDLLVTPVDFLGEGGSASVRKMMSFSLSCPRHFANFFN